MTHELRSKTWAEAERIESRGSVLYRYDDHHDERRFTPREPLNWGDILREIECDGAIPVSGYTREQVFTQAVQFAWYAEYRFAHRFGCTDTVSQVVATRVFDGMYLDTAGFDWMRESQTMFLQVVIYLWDHWAYGEHLHQWFTQSRQ